MSMSNSRVQSRERTCQRSHDGRVQSSPQTSGGQRPGAGDTGMNGLALKVLHSAGIRTLVDCPASFSSPSSNVPTLSSLCLHHPRLYTESRRCNLPGCHLCTHAMYFRLPLSRMSFLCAEPVYPSNPQATCFSVQRLTQIPEPSSAQEPGKCSFPLLSLPSLLTTSRNSCVKMGKQLDF